MRLDARDQARRASGKAWQAFGAASLIDRLALAVAVEVPQRLLAEQLSLYYQRQIADPALKGVEQATTAKPVRMACGHSSQWCRAGRRQAQLREKTGQLGQEIEGLAGQVAAKDKEIALIRQELAGVEEAVSRSGR